jgi:predicted glutamine amidotransferase
MCRFAVYRGKPITLKRLIFEPPHNFVEQSRQPREMIITPINVDGYGLAWYNLEVHPEPAVMTSEKPFWHDINVARIADKIISPTIFVHVRAASPGLLVHQANSHPFQWKNQIFMHNGIISDFKKGMMRAIRQQIADPFYSHLLRHNRFRTHLSSLLEHSPRTALADHGRSHARDHCTIEHTCREVWLRPDFEHGADRWQDDRGNALHKH